MNLPPEVAARSQDTWAVIIGDLGNATAMAVPRSKPEPAWAAAASGRKGSCEVSAEKNPSKPRLDARLADSDAAEGNDGGK